MSNLFAYRAGMAPSDAHSLPLYVIRAADLPKWQQTEGRAWASWLSASGFSAAFGETCLLPDSGTGISGAVLGLGSPSQRQPARFALARAAAELGTGDWHIMGDLAGAHSPDLSQEMMLGWCLSSYRFERYHRRKGDGAPGGPSLKPRRAARLKCPQNLDAARISAMIEGEFLTRDLINTPANDLGPQALQEAFFALATHGGAQAECISGDALLAGGFRMIHAVGRAAAQAPRLLDMRWGTQGPQLTLVGKGVCFDTGGLNIKPGSSMGLMKKDMGGAATVMGLALMIMRLDLPLRLRVLVPAVENAISADSLRPGDILTSRKGLTVEVNNTDAEGRLVLADALDYASEEPEATLISMATLTGAARVALGPDIAPYFCDDETMCAAIESGARTGFDPVWRLPFWPAYEAMIEPEIADLDNAPSGSFAGAITAALFLRRFAATPRYAHFDIYGHSQTNAPGRSKGGLGQGARALLCALPQMLNL